MRLQRIIKKGRFGVDIKKKFGVDNTVLFTAFPDYGSIENAVKSIDFSYTAQRYRDNRPFFQEATSFFYSPYLYTSSIPDFDFGLKVFGKQGKIKYGVMRTEKLGDRSDSMVSASYDLPSKSAVKLSMIGRDDEEINNKVFIYTLESNPTRSLSLWGSNANSLTSGAEKNGTESEAGFFYSNSDVYINGLVGRTSRHFDAASGFVDYAGSKHWSFGSGFNNQRRGKSLRNIRINCWLGRNWDKDHGLINGFTSVTTSLSFANNTSWRLSHNWGPHIANYHDEPGTEYYWHSDSTSRISFNFNTDDRYRSGGITYRWGNEGGGPSESIRVRCGFRPSKKISTNFILQRAKRDNEEEGEITKWLGIFGAKYEISPEKSASAKLVYRKEGTNFTLSYRQQVRKGLDIYALYGDYNADKTQNKFSIKMVMAF